MHRSVVPRSLAVLVVLAIAACSHPGQLVPAPGASTLPGRGQAAEETVEGVRVQVDSDSWRWGRLNEVLVPVLVTIANGASRPVRIGYQQFTNAGPSGFALAALPPYRVAVQNPEPVVPFWAGTGFLYAPWAARFYLYAPVWTGPFPYDPWYYDQSYAGWPAALPDFEVLRRALPEGVLQPGGTVSGFLYFPDQPKGAAVTFRATLVDANTGQVLGTAAIPFLVR